MVVIVCLASMLILVIGIAVGSGMTVVILIVARLLLLLLLVAGHIERVAIECWIQALYYFWWSQLQYSKLSLLEADSL